MGGMASMGPRSFNRGNVGNRQAKAEPIDKLFNGAAVIQPRKRRNDVALSLKLESSSMGPRSFNRGNGISGFIRQCLRRRLFNGAAVIQPRKPQFGLWLNLNRVSSMGPRSFNRGNRPRWKFGKSFGLRGGIREVLSSRMIEERIDRGGWPYCQ